MKYIKIAVPDDFDSQDRILWQKTDALHSQPELLEVWQPVYRDLLDHGHLGLLDFMGGDQTVVNAARVSYGTGTKRVSEDKGLLRYLMRMRHWSPFEMIEFMWRVKAPIFVFRQWNRHRAGVSINEYSARYSILSDEMYMPDAAIMKPQSSTNKQGRSGELNANNTYACQLQLQHIYQECLQAYKYLLGQANLPSASLNRRYELTKEFAMERIKWLEQHDPEWQPDLVTEKMIDMKIAEIVNAGGLAFTDEEFWGENGLGLSRELARICMPLATYSEMYWKCDLRNTFNFISLRSDPHAQEEIRVYSNAMLEMIEPIAPICVGAFVDYEMKGRRFSAMELAVVKEMYQKCGGTAFDELIENIMQDYGASKREIKEFIQSLSTILSPLP